MVAQAYTAMNSSRFPESRSMSAPAGKKGQDSDYYDEVADAADRDRYYAGVKDTFDSASGEDLYRSLNKLISKGTRDLGYKGARQELYSKIDRRPDGNLYYLYSGEGPKNEGDAGGAPRELQNYNCEHVVPQSWFNERLPMKADLHHLFTEQVQCNGSRGNFELTEVEAGETIGACGIVDPSDGDFEPLAGKGEVARATLYFVTRHPGYVGDNDRETSLADVKQLIEWSKQYPVTDYERHRNDTIQDVQGNRNPFIDFPELVEKVDFAAGFRK